MRIIGDEQNDHTLDFYVGKKYTRSSGGASHAVRAVVSSRAGTNILYLPAYLQCPEAAKASSEHKQQEAGSTNRQK